MAGQQLRGLGTLAGGKMIRCRFDPGQRPVEAPDRKGQPLFCHKILTITSNSVCKRPPARQG